MTSHNLLGVHEARQKFSALVSAAETGGQHTILVRRSQPVAVMVSMNWYRSAMDAVGGSWQESPVGEA